MVVQLNSQLLLSKFFLTWWWLGGVSLLKFLRWWYKYVDEFFLLIVEHNEWTHTRGRDCCSQVWVTSPIFLRKLEVEHFISDMTHTPITLRFLVINLVSLLLLGFYWSTMSALYDGLTVIWASLNLHHQLPRPNEEANHAIPRKQSEEVDRHHSIQHSPRFLRMSEGVSRPIQQRNNQSNPLN